MENNTNKPKNFIKSLQIIHFALTSSVVVFALYVVFQSGDGIFFSYQENKAFLYLAIILCFIGNLSSKLIYKKLISQITIEMDLSKKAVKYSTAHILRVAMLEFPAFICIIFAMESNNSFYFILVGILILMMLAIYPSAYKFEIDVPLKSIEKSMLEKL